MRSLDRWSIVLAAVGVAALSTGAAALVLALFAHRTGEHLRAADIRFVESPLATDVWHEDVRWPAAQGRRALGVGDDFRFRAALERFRESDPAVVGGLTQEEVRRRRGVATAALMGHDVRDDEPVRKSQTANVIGVIAMANSVGRLVQQPYFERALRQFRRAIVFDTSNLAAKRNLERLLRRTERGARRNRTVRPERQRQRRQIQPQKYAGVSPSGRGY